MTTLSTHVLDQVRGGAAQGVGLRLDHLGPDGFVTLREADTDADGRARDLLPDGAPQTGTFRLRFAMGPYWAAQGHAGLHPWVDVVFDVGAPGAHWHIPLLAGPFGYTTYRGT